MANCVSDSELQLKHKKWRRRVIVLSTGTVSAIAWSVPSHGISCVGLVYTIPRLSYCTYKMQKHSKELARRNLNKLDYTFGDFFMPVVICGSAGAFGCLADGAAALPHSTAPLHVIDSEAFGTGGFQAISAHIDAIQDPSSAFAEATNLWNEGYHDIARQLRSAVANVTQATKHPEILTSDKFLRNLGSGVMGAFIGELVGKGVEVPSDRTGDAIKMLIDKEDSAHLDILTSDKFIQALAASI